MRRTSALRTGRALLVALVAACAWPVWNPAASETPPRTHRGYPVSAIDWLDGVGGLPGFIDDGWYARIDTEAGAIVARLLPEQAPQSVAHFAALAEGRLEWIDPLTGVPKKEHYYDGLLVHRAVAGERFETGDPTATGRGAPPMYVPPEGAGPVNFHHPWRLGMTRSSMGHISGAMFFATEASLPWLSGRHPCFGEILGGRDVVREICALDTMSDGTPREPMVIERIRVHALGEVSPLPEPRPYRPPTPTLTPKMPGAETPGDDPR